MSSEDVCLLRKEHEDGAIVWFRLTVRSRKVYVGRAGAQRHFLFGRDFCGRLYEALIYAK